ncbi:MAG: methyltransferase domain-containing protein [Balneolaceae bacterium]
MTLELKSPADDRKKLSVPERACHLAVPFNGTISSGEVEYPIRNNIIDLIGGKESSYSIAQQSNQWTLTAKLYEELWRNRSLSILTGEEFPIEKERDLLLEWTDPQPGETWLDIGCSTGLYARMLVRKEPSIRMLALDASEQMLAEAKTRAEAEAADLFLIRADARNLPLFSQEADGLVMGGTLNELTDDLKVLFECRRVLKQQGIFFMMHLVRAETWYGRLFQDSAEWGGLTFRSVEESNRLFERAGFRVEEQLTRSIVCFTKLRPV